MFTSLLFFSNLLTLLLSGNIQTDLFCIRNVQEVFEGTYQFWNTSYNGSRVWDQTTGGERNLLFLGGEKCTGSNEKQQVMTQYSATNCWCIGTYLYTCDYFAPINDTNIGPDKVFHGWFNGGNGLSQDINVTAGRCGSDIPTITTEDFCSSGTPKSYANYKDLDGTFSITEQERNGEYVWYHSEKENRGFDTYDNYLYIGLNKSQCAWNPFYPSGKSIQNPYPYCWCIDTTVPTVTCEIFGPITSKDVLPNEVPIGWYDRNGSKWEEFEFVIGEGCNNDVNRLHYSLFVTFLCYFVTLVLQ